MVMVGTVLQNGAQLLLVVRMLDGMPMVIKKPTQIPHIEPVYLLLGANARQRQQVNGCQCHTFGRVDKEPRSAPRMSKGLL